MITLCNKRQHVGLRCAQPNLRLARPTSRRSALMHIAIRAVYPWHRTPRHLTTDAPGDR